MEELEIGASVALNGYDHQFVIAKGSETVATIECTHLLRTQYVISLAGGATWVFRMPLFRARFSGSSIQGRSLYVSAWRENPLGSTG